MQAVNTGCSFGSMITESTTNHRSSQFAGRDTTESDARRHTESNGSLAETPSLKDRLIYPFRAAKKRIINMAGLGGVAGLYSPIIGVGGICGLVGHVIGSTVGKLIKCLFFSGSDVSPGNVGLCIGFYLGALLTSPAAITLGAVAATAFAVIGLAGSVLALPVDIYHAITLDNKADLSPEPRLGMKMWNEIRRPDFNGIFDSF